MQEELEKVLAGKAPTFADEGVLPQLKAFVLETYRWRPVTVSGKFGLSSQTRSPSDPVQRERRLLIFLSGVAHRATKDIPYGPYIIPAGASVIANHWAIGHDPDVFPDPEHFDPQRWRPYPLRHHTYTHLNIFLDGSHPRER